MQVLACRFCEGYGCEEGCGRCEMAYAGPDSHRVCVVCHGLGEHHDDRCESEWESGAMAYTPCGCAERANLMSDEPTPSPS